MKETTINIQGMMCEHCKKSVTEALSKLEGVTEVEVSLDTGQAKVNYDSNKTDIEDLKGVILEAGFQV